MDEVEVEEEVEQKGVDGGWVGGGEWVVVLSLITSQDGQERETPERMLLHRARRRPVCWIEANISAMSYHQPYTRIAYPCFSPISLFLPLSIFVYQRVSSSLFHPRRTVSIRPRSTLFLSLSVPLSFSVAVLPLSL